MLMGLGAAVRLKLLPGRPALARFPRILVSF